MEKNNNLLEISQTLIKNKIWNFKNQTTKDIYKNYFTFLFYSDNYGYIIHDSKAKILIGIDFGDFAQSKTAVDLIEDLTKSKLKYIFTTHSHSDHCGANGDWKNLLKDQLKIFSGDTPKIKVPHTDTFLKDKEEVSFGGNIKITCHHTPGHIQSHVCYLIEDKEFEEKGLNFAFTGDTLFSAGCGRIFSGTHEEMFQSLNFLKSLPRQTLIFCGHEYTLKNLQFALSLEPNNDTIKRQIEEVEKLLNENENTMGMDIEDECKYNPFFRCDEDYFKKKFGVEDSVEIFKIIRKMKDKF